MVILYGTIVRQVDRRILFRVDAELGDAPTYELHGELWLGRHQCIEICDAQQHGEPDVIRISEALARAKRPATTPPQQQGRR